MVRFRFEKRNKILFALALLMIAAGFIIMNTGDNTLSPVILVIAYVVILPLSLLI